jgi:hypothetical protein
MITVLRARGIGESMDEQQMLANVTRELDPARFIVKDVPWSAQYGVVPSLLGESFDRAISLGRSMLLNMIELDPNPVVLLGYSGGAALAGNVACEIAMGVHPYLDIRGVGLIADPCRSTLNSVNAGASGWGIARPRGIGGKFPTWQLADPRDAITCCPPNSPLRAFADESAAFSLVDPTAWGEDLLDRLATHEWQPVSVQPATVFAQLLDAVDDVRGYLWHGDHTSYHLRRVPGTTRTYCEWLADRINEVTE